MANVDRTIWREISLYFAKLEKYKRKTGTWKGAEQNMWKDAVETARRMERLSDFKEVFKKAYIIGWDKAWEAAKDHIQQRKNHLSEELRWAAVLKTIEISDKFLIFPRLFIKEGTNLIVSSVIFPNAVVMGKWAAMAVIEDSEKFKVNPFERYIKLLEMGLKPVGFKNLNNQETFVVDIPTKEKGKSFLLCHAHGDKVRYAHEWDEDCSDRKIIDQFLSNK